MCCCCIGVFKCILNSLLLLGVVTVIKCVALIIVAVSHLLVVSSCDEVQNYSNETYGWYSLYKCNSTLYDKALMLTTDAQLKLNKYNDYYNVFVMWIIMDVFWVLISCALIVGAFINMTTKPALFIILPNIILPGAFVAIDLIIFTKLSKSYGTPHNPWHKYFKTNIDALNAASKKHEMILVDVTTYKTSFLVYRLLAHIVTVLGILNLIFHFFKALCSRGPKD